ncbi:MAG: DinB family protein [Saprospiraceae bacterium]|nr:DinB family protein [Saprospiraceae bacterium]
MKDKILDWERQINVITQDFKDSFGQLSASDLNWKPNTQTWSVAQNIDHLIVINKTYYPVIEQLRNGTYKLPFVAKLGFLTNFFGNFILKSVAADRRKKIKTFPIWEPSQSRISGDILLTFDKHQQELIAFFKSCEDLLSQNTIISSPANRVIVYPLSKAFNIIVEHEKRHLNQAKETWALK